MVSVWDSYLVIFYNLPFDQHFKSIFCCVQKLTFQVKCVFRVQLIDMCIWAKKGSEVSIGCDNFRIHLGNTSTLTNSDDLDIPERDSKIFHTGRYIIAYIRTHAHIQTHSHTHTHTHTHTHVGTDTCISTFIRLGSFGFGEETRQREGKPALLHLKIDPVLYPACDGGVE